jgi:hypothetical protein
MDYLDFIGAVHERLEPPTYLEIGIRFGASLALSKATTVGVDPAYELRHQAPDGAELFRETSDAFFERTDALRHFEGRPAAMSFIDGMHLAEYALRDFINVEAHSHWTSAVIFDDILPRDADEAARERTTRVWAGDVFKIMGIFEQQRPDLIVLRVGTEPTGLLLVLGLDPASSVLSDRYDELEREIVTPDPQELPRDVVEHKRVLDPDKVLSASFWELLREARTNDTPRDEGIKALRKAVKKDLGRGALSGRRLLDALPSRA